jgi:DNA repair exonuclease SbcCD ATPase subunit
MSDRGVTVREAVRGPVQYEDRFYSDDQIRDLFGVDNDNMVVPLLNRAQQAEAEIERLRTEVSDLRDTLINESADDPERCCYAVKQQQQAEIERLRSTVRALQQQVAEYEQRAEDNAEMARTAEADVQRLRQQLAMINREWQFGVQDIDTPWRRRMARLVGDNEGLEAAKEVTNE